MVTDTWIGKQLGSYKILRLVGKGGSGRVYRAKHTFLDREVAIKVLRADLDARDEHHERFLQEARTISQMRHPHIVQLFDFGQSQDTYYMVMEYVPGDSLEKRLKAVQTSGRLLPGVDVWRIVKQMGEGLTYIHEQGVIHRDIKPANILLDPSGKAVISDFGVSKLLAGQGNTTTGTITGTPAYMSPEQAVGHDIDHRADLYSMAIIVYEMLVGRVPFSAKSPVTVILKHLHEPVDPPRKLNPALPRHIDSELVKALSKRPENRHGSVAEFLHALAATGRVMQGVETEAAPKQVKTVVGPDGKEYIHIPAGEFVMGSPHEDDTPRHKVYLDGFYISRYPVTNAEYHAFVQATFYMPPQHWRGDVYPSWEADRPITYVSWHDAAAYCRWVGGRLPTEAEWEHAARGTDERKYPWGNTFDASHCNSREAGIKRTTSVGQYSPLGDSPFGVGDLAGNVFEWVHDWYTPAYNEIGGAPAHNPMGPPSGKVKVIRGGSFNNSERLVTCYTRDHALPNVRAVNYGFRVRLSEEVFRQNSELPDPNPL
jgi:serine/threonine-protein kinase